MTTRFTNRRNVLRGIGTAGALSLTGVGTALASEDPAGIRVAHLSPDAPAVDVYLDGEKAVSGLEYKTVTGYLDVSAGTYTATVTPAGKQDSVVASARVTLESGTDYTVNAIGELSNDSLVLDLEHDDNSAIEGKARVKVYHASLDAGPLTLQSEHRQLTRELEHGDASGYGVNTSTSGWSFVDRNYWYAEEVFEFDDRPLETGKCYTIFLTGYRSPEHEPGDDSLDTLFASVDTPRERNTGSPTTTTPEESDDDEMAQSDDPSAPGVRVAHLSPDAPAVDIYLDGQRAVSGLEFSDVTDYLRVPAGAYTAEITPAGDPDTVVYEDELPLAEDNDYTVGAVGELGNDTFEALLYVDNLSRTGRYDSRVRVYHASPDAGSIDILDYVNPIADDVTYTTGQETPLPPDGQTFDFDIRDGSGVAYRRAGEKLASFTLTPETETVYSVFVTGYRYADGPSLTITKKATETRRGDDVGPTAAGKTLSGLGTRLRVAHMSPDTGSVSVTAENVGVFEDTLFEGASFTDVSDYRDVPTGTYALKGTQTVTTDVEKPHWADRYPKLWERIKSRRTSQQSTSQEQVFQTTAFLPAKSDYSLVVVGESSAEKRETSVLKGLLFKDDNRPVESGQSRVRAIHASPDAPAVDVTVNDASTTLFDGLGYEEGRYTAVPAGEYELEIRPDSETNDDPRAIRAPVDVSGSGAYTAFVAGYFSPEDEPESERIRVIPTRDS
jgi:hypothetical protein